MKYIIAIGIFQALVAIMLLIKSKLRSGADGLLILLVTCIATHLLIKFFIFNFTSDIHIRLQMNTFLGFCYGPLLYLYAKKLKEPAFIPSTRWYIFTPFIVAMIGYFSVLTVLNVAPQKAYALLDFYNVSTIYTIIPSNIIYALLALNLIKQVDEQYYRETKLAKQLAYAFLVLGTIGSFFAILHNQDYQLNLIVRSVCYSIFIGICVVILRYRFLLIQHNALQQQIPLDIKEITKSIVKDVTPELNPDILFNEANEQKKSILSQEEQANVWKQLEIVMNTTKAFTDGALNLDKLTELTGINKYHISETLNNFSNKSFYQYINEYRIQFAIDQMKYLTEREIAVNILSLAYDAGFNAKSSFNRYFKEITQQTPSAYLKALQHDMAMNNLNSALA